MEHGILCHKGDISAAAKFLYKSPTIYTCRNVIQQHLFSNGILFTHRRGRVRPDPHMQEIMSDHWLPFCKDMLDTVLIQGFVVVRIVDMGDGLRVPVALEPNSCEVHLKYNLGLREYTATDTQNQIIPDSIVFDMFGYSPTSSGRSCSLVSNLLPTVNYMNALQGSSLYMEKKRANPLLMTEAVDTKSDNVEGIQYDYYADGDMQDDSNRNQFERNRSNVKQLAEQQQLYDSFFMNDNGLPVQNNPLENMVPLPMGQRLVTVPQMTGRGDLVAQVKLNEDIICGAMGVPRSLFMSDTPHKSDSEGTHQTFQKTIMNWKTILQSACEQIYNLVYAEDIQSQLLKAMGNKKRKRETDIADVYALKKRLQVEIVFPVSPFANVEKLHQHWERGLLPWDKYQQHVCNATSIEYTAMPEPSRGKSESSVPGGRKEEEKVKKESGGAGTDDAKKVDNIKKEKQSPKID